MPYEINSSNLPSYVKDKPKEVRAKWIHIFNSVYAEHGEEMAFIVANKWLKRFYAENKYIKRSIVVLSVDKSQGFIKRSDDGNEYITLLLGDLEPHLDGKVYTEELLKGWADDINKGETVIGDIDHTSYDKILSSLMTDEQVKAYLKRKPGIAKSVKAIFDKGKLWIRAMIDKRYRRIIENSKGVSAEAIVNTDGQNIKNGKLLGFTFNVNTTPAVRNAGVVA